MADDQLDEALGHRGRRGDPLYGILRLLLVADEVGAALLAKELLRETYGDDGA